VTATATRSTSSSTPSTKKRSQGWKVIRWIEEFCVHTNGEWIGKPFHVLDWQKRLILALFEVGDDDLRIYRWALIGLPKKNGKTELAAALGLYFLIGDGEPSPLVVCAAASEEQADLVYNAAKTMCEMSEPLSQITECYDKEILVPSIPGAKLLRVAAAAGTNDGKNIHAVICDELHEWVPPKGDKVWNVLTNGTGARRQPMVLQVTTAGYDIDGTVCGQQYTKCKAIQNGQIDDGRYFFYWVEAPEGSDYRDPEVWKAANPSFGVLVHADFFRDQLGKKTESVFRRYFLNQWVMTEEIWIQYGVWDACESDLDLDAALPIYVGIDIAKNIDSSALVVAQKQEERFVVRATVWSNPYPLGHSLHDGWRMNNNLVMERCRALRDEFPRAACEIDHVIMPGPMFAYDPYRFREEAEVLTGEGLAMVEFPQHDSRMIPASQAFFEAIMKGRIAHNGDPILKDHVQHVAAEQKPRGWRMSRPTGARHPNDAAIAAAIAVYQAQTTTPPAPKPSVYERRGLLVISAGDDEDEGE
jgi:phage terminase large subunit-like protein